jgi:hypothetical protein
VVSARRGGSFSSGGGSVATRLAIALLVGSIGTMLFGAFWMLLTPASVLAGAIWQPVTYAFVETSPLALVMGAAVLVTIGGELESRWGPRLLVRFLLGVTIISGFATTLVALAIPYLRYAYFAGGGVMSAAAWTAYGWTLGRARANFMGIIVTGDQLALIGIGFVAIEAAYSGLAGVIPEAIAIFLTWVYVRAR